MVKVSKILFMLLFGHLSLFAQVQPDPRVLVKQAGAGSSQVLKWTGTKWEPKDDRERDRYYSVKEYAAFAELTKEQSFTFLSSYYSTRSGFVLVDTTVNITTNTTVTSDIRVVKNGLFNISNTVTLTLNGDFQANNRQQVFNTNTSGNVAFGVKAVPEIYPYWFGAIADGSTNCQPAAQKAINVAIASQVKIVRFLDGQHVMNTGLVIKNGASVVTLELRGEKCFDAGANGGTSLLYTSDTDFGIGVQGGRSVVIEGFYIRGKGATYNPTLAQVIQNSDAEWSTQWGRNDRYSPNGAIVIDPFKTTAPTGGGYPSFSAEYTGSNGFSSDITIQDVIIRYWIGGIVISPSGADGNGSEINILNVNADRCQYGIATGGTQNRQVNVQSSVIVSTVCFDGLAFGTQNGPCPIVSNTEVGICRDVMRFNSGVGAGGMNNVYGESIYRIGQWNGAFSPLVFNNCEFNFTTFAESGVADAASVLDALQTNVEFFGGKLFYSNARPIEMYCYEIVLNAVSLSSPILNQPNGGKFEESVVYKNCRLQGVSGTYNLNPFNSNLQVQNPGDVRSGPLVLKGQKIAFYEQGLGATNYVVYSQDMSAYKNVTFMDAGRSVTINNTLKTASFTSAQAGKYKIGDVLFTYDNNSAATPTGNTKACSFGKVSAVSGTSIICDNIPDGISSGTYNIYLYEFKAFVPTCLGSFVSGSNKVTITSKPTGSTVAQIWPVGTRVHTRYQDYNFGVYNGLYVASVTADTLFLSGNVGATASNEEFYCAPLTAVYVSFDGSYQTPSSTYRNVGYRLGDIIQFKGHAYRDRAVVTVGGFTPTVKMIFRPISGTTGARPTPEAVDVGLQYFNTSTNTTQWWDGSAWREAGATATDLNGIYSGSGTVPNNTVATLTNELTFLGNDATGTQTAPFVVSVTGTDPGVQTWKSGTDSVMLYFSDNEPFLQSYAPGDFWLSAGSNDLRLVGDKVVSYGAQTVCSGLLATPRITVAADITLAETYEEVDVVGHTGPVTITLNYTTNLLGSSSRTVKIRNRSDTHAVTLSRGSQSWQWASMQGTTTTANQTIAAGGAVNLIWNDEGATDYFILHQIGGGGTATGETIISPAQLTAAANDWNPTDLSTASIIRLSGDNGFRIISGITAPSSPKELTLTNVGTDYPVLVTREDAASSAANRFAIARDIPLYPLQSATFYYDATASRWRLRNMSEDREGTTGKVFSSVFMCAGSTTSGDYDHWTFQPGAGGNISSNAPSSTRPRNLTLSSGASSTNAANVSTKGAGMYLGKTSTVPNAIYTKVVFSLDNLSDGTNTFTILAGITANTSAFSNPADGAHLRYVHSANSGKWLAVTRTGGAETTTDSGVTVAANTVYTVEVFHRPDNSDAFWLNGAYIGEHTTNNHDGYAYPILSFIKSAGTNPRVVQLDAIEYIESRL